MPRAFWEAISASVQGSSKRSPSMRASLPVKNGTWTALLTMIGKGARDTRHRTECYVGNGSPHKTRLQKNASKENLKFSKVERVKNKNQVIKHHVNKIQGRKQSYPCPVREVDRCVDTRTRIPCMRRNDEKVPLARSLTLTVCAPTHQHCGGQGLLDPDLVNVALEKHPHWVDKNFTQKYVRQTSNRRQRTTKELTSPSRCQHHTAKFCWRSRPSNTHARR